MSIEDRLTALKVKGKLILVPHQYNVMLTALSKGPITAERLDRWDRWVGDQNRTLLGYN